MIATVSAVAFIFFSCKSKISEAERIDLENYPLQVVDSMRLLQTNRGHVEMRVVTGRMERYQSDSLSYELFPNGIWVYAYTEDGSLESTIVADEARHEQKSEDEEAGDVWEAYGNVVVRNVMKDETMETDTLYWDRTSKEIYTDCYIRMYSPDGFMQGFGMRSDERARNAVIQRPFNSYGVVVKDSTEVIIDTANFIGPLLPKTK